MPYAVGRRIREGGKFSAAAAAARDEPGRQVQPPDLACSRGAVRRRRGAVEVNRPGVGAKVRSLGAVVVDPIAKIDRDAPVSLVAEHDVEPVWLTFPAIIGAVDHKRLVGRDGRVTLVGSGRANHDRGWRLVVVVAQLRAHDVEGVGYRVGTLKIDAAVRDYAGRVDPRA